MESAKIKYRPGDEVWVAQQVDGGRMRPVKLNVFAVQITDFGMKQNVVYFGPNGQPLEAEVYPTIEVCEKAINIIETHRKAFGDAMEALSKETAGSPLVDAAGNKLV